MTVDASKGNHPGAMLLFCGTSFLGAFLLFQVQPVISKSILPWFGGGPAVWTTAMLFFQVFLFVGYLYAYLVERYFSPRTVATMHVLLLLAAVASLPIGVDASWRSMSDGDPGRRVLLVLLVSVGLPYFVLASTAPLVQAWFTRVQPLSSPYRLYSLSNAGSLLALLSYPLAVERLVGLRMQALLWSGTFLVFVFACSTCGVLAASRRPGSITSSDAPPADTAKNPSKEHRFLWLLFPLCSSTLLLAITNYLCQEVASLPFLWVVPLSVYLLTFILCFESDRWYRRLWWLAAALVLTLAAGSVWGNAKSWPLTAHIGLGLALLFACCMICHGEVARIRPPASRLTSFYLYIAGGGALGGLLVNLLAPLLFTRFLELPLAVILCWLLALAAMFGDPQSPLFRGRSFWGWVAILFVLGNVAVWMVNQYTHSGGRALYRGRNFYGVVEVQDTNWANYDYRATMLRHGRITHGVQFVNGERHKKPLHYFSPESGVGRVLSHDDRRARRIAVTGLGIGTLAAYGRSGDVIRFYEINPLVASAAQEWFSYLKDSAAKVEVVVGDARLMLDQELIDAGPHRLDVLILDAFSGDTIPVHLLTREAFEMYDRHLAPDGVLVVHVSSLYFDLIPVVAAAVMKLGYDVRVVDTPGTADEERLPTTFIVASKDKGYFDRIGIAGTRAPVDGPLSAGWTDDFSNLWGSLR
ncbi:MAG: fused MFS/spermidine synthase [Pirellulales bacterium]